ncbi:MAG: DHH family phosphoesterase [Pseudobutyrivibrio sp.]|nr:DHH family phosphoesterase [Pseudobutyrivibrio sp.]
MKLSELLKYDNIAIQCHNNPDADALASGLGLLNFLGSKGKNAVFIYGGYFEITKSNLKLMIKNLKIDVHHVQTQDEIGKLLGLAEGEVPGLLVTVDAQINEGNVQRFSAKKYAVIDHHQVAGKLPKLSEVRSYQASCSTIIWKMLIDEGYPVNDDTTLSTALYYGLMTDSDNFSVIHHPLDMDMREDLNCLQSEIVKFKNSNISPEELRIAGIALLGAEYYGDNRYSIIKTDPCDPNILGVISDMLLEVDNVDCCLAYTLHGAGIKISVRSCVKEVKADELARFICEGLGNGGGHLLKAGGFIAKSLFEQRKMEFTPAAIQEFFRSRMQEYFASNNIIYAYKYKADTSSMDVYEKKKIELGYVRAKDFMPIGTIATIRTLEGDVNIEVKDDTYIMIGIKGEIYPMEGALFEKSYEVNDNKYEYPAEYEPVVKDTNEGQDLRILPYAHSCTSTGKEKIYAKKIEERTKVFTKWDPENYYLGKPGDYMAVKYMDKADVYIIERDIFLKTYKKVED